MFDSDNFRPELAVDVISDVDVDHVDVDVPVKLGDFSSSPSRDIPAAQFVRYDDERRRCRPTDHVVIRQSDLRRFA